MSNTPTIPVGALVLVTGATGFVAAHVVKAFLQRGYRVRGTVRDKEQASWLVEGDFKPFADSGALELVVVPDLAVPGAFDEAVKGVAAIAHVASVLTFDPNPKNVVPQTVAGVISVLEAAAKEPSVREFVFTSSIAAAIMPAETNKENTWVDRDAWNEAAVKAAWAPPPYEPTRAMITYAASKVAAEKALWEFTEERKPHFTVNSVGPSGILGEPLHVKHVENAGNWVARIFKKETAFLDAYPSMFFANVHDIATLHVGAILDPEIRNARLHCWGYSANWNDFLAVLRELRPQTDFISDYPDPGHLPLCVDQSGSEAILKKWAGQDDWKSLRQSIKEAIENPYFKL